MDTRSGHLVTNEQLERLKKQFGAYFGDRYDEVPEELEHAARRKLAGRQEALVSRTSGGKLSTWAKQRRERLAAQTRRSRSRGAVQRRRVTKNRRRMASQSRKKNRS